MEMAAEVEANLSMMRQLSWMLWQLRWMLEQLRWMLELLAVEVPSVQDPR